MDFESINQAKIEVNPEYLEGVSTAYPGLPEEVRIERAQILQCVSFGHEFIKAELTNTDTTFYAAVDKGKPGLMASRFWKVEGGIKGWIQPSRDFWEALPMMLDVQFLRERMGRTGIRFQNIFQAAAVIGAHETRHANPEQQDMPHLQLEQVKVMIQGIKLPKGINHNSLYNAQPRERDSIAGEGRMAAAINPKFRLDYNLFLSGLEKIWAKYGKLLEEK